MKKYMGKTLLILGSNIGASDIVLYAKSHGAYTIVIDYYPPERSKAKYFSDENYLISTADTEKISQLIEEKHVDGILAGISEFNLLQAMMLSEKYDLPFYCTLKQWNMIERKSEFRKICERHKVPCPKTYYMGGKMTEKDWCKCQFPAVIKPVDACTSAGVFFCENIDDVKVHEDDSLSKSSSGEIIVEEFVKGKEFTAHYTIVNGKASLSSIDNRYPISVHSGRVTTVPGARIYPSTYIDEYIKQVDTCMISLCENLNISVGILFVQGIYDSEKNRFAIFEAGLRSAGEAPYRFIEKINGINAMHILVDHALSVKPEYDLLKEDPYMKGKCCGIVSFVAKSGTVGSIIGLEEAIAATPSVIEYESRYPIGSTTPDGDTLRQLMIRFVMICQNREQMIRDVEYLNENIMVLNDKGEEMVIKLQSKQLYGNV